MAGVGWKGGQVTSVGLLSGGAKQGFTAAGLNIGAGGRVSVDMHEVMTAFATIASFGMSGASLSAAESIGKSVMEGIFNYGLAVSAPAINFNGEYLGWRLETWKNKRRTHGKYVLDQTRIEEMYGALYLGDAQNSSISHTGPNPCSTDWACVRIGTPSNYTGSLQFKFDNGSTPKIAATDMHIFLDNPDYHQIAQPTSIAYDQFSVMGQGVSGNIQPYRLETGSLAFPRRMTSNERKNNLIPFLTNSGSNPDYKVNFRYVGEFSNNYTHQKGASTDGYSYGIADYSDNTGLYYTYNDPTLTDPDRRVESDRVGLNNKRLISGKHIEWFSNNEIASNTPVSDGKLIDFLPGSQRSTFRNALPPNGIGGFSVTSEDGTTYHYALPVYNKKQYSYTNTSGNYSSMTMNSPYAVTWLLTAITSADFVDRGEKGIIDDLDWGHWVKFDYGKFSSNYHWRNPYWSYDQVQSGNSFSYSEGLKETYYLNSIKTRSHIAIFIKDMRVDGRAAYARSLSLTYSTPLSHDDTYPSSSLKLNEIILLTNEDYNDLVSQHGLTVNSSNSFNINGDTYNNVFDVNDISSIRTYIDQKQLSKTVFNYDYSLCNKTVNSFSDPANPPRSYDPATRTGKLTLKGVSVYGTNNVRLFPDTQFDYGTNNPDYAEFKWDGWGMYNGDGSGSHRASLNPEDRAAWSLVKINTPLGGMIEVSYEADDYASISGNSFTEPVPDLFVRLNYGYNQIEAPAGTNLNGLYKPGDAFVVRALVEYFEPTGNPEDPCEPVSITRDFTFHVQSISNNILYVTENMNNTIVNCGEECYENMAPTPPCSPPFVSQLNCSVIRSKKAGGDIRVSQIKTSDGVNTYKSRYIYTTNGLASGLTSGVVAKEPEFISTNTYSFDNLYDYPITPVLYGKVTVLNGKLSTDNDFVNKTEYNFRTPDPDMVSLTVPYAADYQLNFASYGLYSTFIRKRKFNLDIKTGKIGQVLSIISYDKNGSVLNKSTFGYTDSDKQGIRYEGTILSEQERYAPNWINQNPNDFWHRIFRTEKRYIPSVLTSITNTSGGISSTVVNKVFDYYTGQVLETEFKDALGLKYQSVLVPAYEKYSRMGSKVLDPANKNMMSQITGEYLYKNKGGWTYQAATLSSATSNGNTTYTMNLGNYVLPPYYRVGYAPPYGIDIYSSQTSGQVHLFPIITEIASDRKSFKFIYNDYTLNTPASMPYVTLDPVSVGIQTWDNQWYDRAYDDGDPLAYFKYPLQDDGLTLQDERIWRKKSTYVWSSPLLNADGTYQNFVDFTWSGTEHQNWQKTGEVIHYDPYSKPIEVKDINGNYTSMKLGYDDNYSLTSAANSKFGELGYSGAEDLIAINNQFGGEIGMGSGSVDNTKAHTGQSSLKLDQDESGFLFKGMIVSTDIEENKKYRASVWVYNNGNTDANLFWKIQNADGTIVSGPGASVSIATSEEITAGNWKLLTLDMTVPSGHSGKYLVVGCNNPSATVAYFDDIRFHPLNTTITSNVYDPKTGLVTHVLDANNFYIRYEYDDRNRIKGVFKETKNGEIKLSEYKYNYALDN